MKSLSELEKITLKALDTTFLYEVETSADDNGGHCFGDLNYAYIYLSRVLKKQTNPDLFECGDFVKIGYIQLSIHFIGNEGEKIPLVLYARKNDTEFIEMVI